MKALLAVATVALITLVMEEKARQLAGDAQQAVGEAAHQARATRDTLSHKMEDQPLMGVAVAAIVGFVLSRIVR